MRLVRFPTALLLACWLCSACSGHFQRAGSPERPQQRTVVLFLVDGLATRPLQAAFNSGLMPRTRHFFLRGGSSFLLGRANFPSLTYPNIASILTASPVGEQPILSNHVAIGGRRKVVNFESVGNHGRLRDLVDPLTVIGRLEERGQESASFSYVFGMNASDHLEPGIREGLEYARHDYRDLDDRLIRRLEEFLDEREQPSGWPAFLYVHLVGVDGTAHQHGPGSPAVQSYLAWLDRRLRRVLSRFERAERRGHGMVTMLTADHGFVESRRFVDLEQALRRLDRKILVTNETRFLGLHFPADRPEPGYAEAVLEGVRAMPGVELTAFRAGDRLVLQGRGGRQELLYGPALCPGEPFSLAPVGDSGAGGPAFRCPGAFDAGGGLYPFLVSSLGRFLWAANHPDAVALADTETAFTKGARGTHGGLTADELFVPVLLRGASVGGQGAILTSDLLKILQVKPLPVPPGENEAEEASWAGRVVPGHYLE